MNEIEIIKLVTQPLLTVAGWFVAAWWAIEQVKVAHDNNSKLQRDIIREGHQRDLSKELIEIYKCISRSGHNLKQNIYSFGLNHGFEEGGDFELDNIYINANNLVAPINDSYNDFSQEIWRLEMWLRVSDEHLPDVSLLKNAISEYKDVFTTIDYETNRDDIHWTKYQGVLVAYASRVKIDHDCLREISNNIADSLNRILESLTDGTALINKALIKVQQIN